MNSQGPQERSITEAAADWAVRLHAAPLSAAEQAELQQWQAEDPRHVEALGFARQTWAVLGDLAAQDIEPGALHAPHRALAPPPPLSQRPRRRRIWRRAASVALLLLAVGVAGVQGPHLWLRAQADYFTSKGEVRSVQLMDGSRVQLDTDSAIALDFDENQRHVRLLAGSAVFDVAPMGEQESRPFVVESAGGTTRALGTRFVVGREGAQQAWVGVLQHSVAVNLQAPAHSGPSQRVLEEGQSARYNPLTGVVALDLPDLQRATGWSRGVLVFDRVPLATVVEQLNRYRPGRVMLGSHDLALRQVSGVFRLDMLDAALSTLTHELRVQRFDLAGVSLIY